MIYDAPLDIRKKLFPLFQNMQDTCILSCLQGHMGQAWVDNLEKPKAAQIIVGDFGFYAGDAELPEADELLTNLPHPLFAIVEADAWKKRIESVHKDSAEKRIRYHFRKNPADLDVHHLRTFLQNLPTGYELKKIDDTIARKQSLYDISEDFTGQFDSIEDFIARGIGYSILFNNEVVCAASSYSIYNEGIEIEIGTAPNHQRKGLATVAAAALIIDCLENGLYPSWDAANLESAKLAKKLGFVMEGAYDTYYIQNKRIKVK